MQGMKAKKTTCSLKKTDSLLISNHKTMRFPKLEDTDMISAGWKTWIMMQTGTAITAGMDKC